MAWAHPRPATGSLRWSCKRCYTVNALGSQFCSDCGLAPQGGTVAAVAPSIDDSGLRFWALPVALALVAVAMLIGLLIR